jgi:hypothetical protein
VYLVVLGLPWNRALGSVLEPLGPWVMVLSPCINVLLVYALCRAWGIKRSGA